MTTSFLRRCGLVVAAPERRWTPDEPVDARLGTARRDLVEPTLAVDPRREHEPRRA